LPNDSILLTLAAFGAAADELPTMMATSVSQAEPETPHAFTCSVCPPAEAQTFVVIAGAFTMVVLVLLSSEYPTALTCCPEQSDVNADN
jgi:hypothetical protein